MNKVEIIRSRSGSGITHLIIDGVRIENLMNWQARSTYDKGTLNEITITFYSDDVTVNYKE